MSKNKVKRMEKWKRSPGMTGSTCGAKWILLGTKYVVRHCGHPTALWPYYGVRPDGTMILSSSGRGFTRLDEAKQAVLKEAEALG